MRNANAPGSPVLLLYNDIIKNQINGRRLSVVVEHPLSRPDPAGNNQEEMQVVLSGVKRESSIYGSRILDEDDEVVIDGAVNFQSVVVTACNNARKLTTCCLKAAETAIVSVTSVLKL